MRRTLLTFLLLVLAAGALALTGYEILKDREGAGFAGIGREPEYIQTSGSPETDRSKEADTSAAPAVPEMIVIDTETQPAETPAETQPAEPETPAARTEPVRLAFAGDILFDPGYAIMASMLSRGGGSSGSLLVNAFGPSLVERMRSADLMMLNNEFPYTGRGTPTAGKKFTFRADPKYASLLFDIGVDLVGLANNHAYDYGEVSLLDTLDTLQSIGMPYVGAGRNLEEASAPLVFEIGGLKIAYLAATQIERNQPPDTRGAGENTPGVFRCMDDSLLLKRIRQAKEENDFVVVFIHWGTEGTDQTDWLQQQQAPEIAAAGADLIIGAHPHVLQGISYEGNVPVFYSLGNYLFNSRTLDTCLVTVSVDPATAQILDLEFVPASQSGCRTTELEGSEKARVLQYMQSLSPGVQIDGEGHITKKGN